MNDKPTTDLSNNLQGLEESSPVKHVDKKRIPGVRSLPDNVRNHVVAMTGEFIGTFLFLFMAYSGTQIANSSINGATITSPGSENIPNVGALIYVSLCFGFSLVVNAWVFFRISGGLFNPAVTLGMALIKAVPWLRAGLLIVSQILGAMSSAAVVSCLFPGPLLASTTLGGGTSIVQGLFIEMFLTAELVFTIFMLAAEKHKGRFIAPLGIGLSLFIAELTGVWFTGGSLNPARSFAPCVVLLSFPGYHWIYWVGPGLGACLASGFYWFVKKLEYETTNPGAEFDHEDAEAAKFKYDADPNALPSNANRASSMSLDTRRSTDSSPERFRHPAAARRAAPAPMPPAAATATTNESYAMRSAAVNGSAHPTRNGVDVLTPHDEKTFDDANDIAFRHASGLESGTGIGAGEQHGYGIPGR